MEMTGDAWVHIGIAVLGYVAVIATMRTRLGDHGRRITKLEEKHDKLSIEFVPRPEVKAQLEGIERAIADVKGLLQVALYSGKAGSHHKHEA